MLVVELADVESWTPNFASSGQANPKWTRVRASGTEICDTLEGVEWLDNPVQVTLCDACGTPECASGGYTHISRVGPDLLWTAPQLDSDDAFEVDRRRTSFPVAHRGGLLIPEVEWRRWQKAVDTLPSTTTFPHANRRAIADAWRMGVVGRLRAGSVSDISSCLREYALASDSMELADAVATVRRLVEWALRSPEAPAQGQLVRASDFGTRVEVIYTDGKHEEDWPAFGHVGSRLAFALGREHVFVPADLADRRPYRMAD
jgi:hypothetical protein